MFEKLEIRNFQKHELLRMRCGSKITSIVGASDRGKSSIIRALKWVCLNRPRGDAMIRWGEERCRVRLWADDHRVSRAAGKGGNIYRLDDAEPYRAFGADVPGPIADVLRVDDLNFQLQHDNAYLLSASAAEAARALNRVVNLEAMDAALAAAAAGTRKAKTQVEVAEERLAKTRTDVEALAWVKAADLRLTALEDQEAQLDAVRGRLGALAGLLQRLRENAARVREFPDAEYMETAYKELRTAQRRRRDLEALIAKIQEAEAESCRTRERSKKAAEELQKSIGDRCPICGGKAPAPSPSV